MDGGAWQATTVHGVAKGQTRLSDFTFTHLKGSPGSPGGAIGKDPTCQWGKTIEMWVQSLGQEDPLEEGMASHTSILAWKIPWTEEPGGLQSTGSQRVRHNPAHRHGAWNPNCLKLASPRVWLL